VHCDFETTRQRLAELVTRHKQSLTVLGSGCVEFTLLDVRTIVTESVLGPAPRLFGLQGFDYAAQVLAVHIQDMIPILGPKFRELLRW
jgi:hypothetical protein